MSCWNEAGADVLWMASTRLGVDTTTASATGVVTFTFDYGPEAENLSLTAFLRTNRDSADAEDELFRVEATPTTAMARREATTPTATTTPVVRGGATTTHPDRTVKITDAQTQAYVVNFPGTNNMTINEGGMAGLEFEAVPDRTVELPFNVTLSSPNDVSDYSLVGTTGVSISEDYTLGDDGRRMTRSMLASRRSRSTGGHRTTATGWTTSSRRRCGRGT